MTLSEELRTQNMRVTWSSFFDGEVGRCGRSGVHCQTDLAALNCGKKTTEKAAGPRTMHSSSWKSTTVTQVAQERGRRESSTLTPKFVRT